LVVVDRCDNQYAMSDVECAMNQLQDFRQSLMQTDGLSSKRHFFCGGDPDIVEGGVIDPDGDLVGGRHVLHCVFEWGLNKTQIDLLLQSLTECVIYPVEFKLQRGARGWRRWGSHCNRGCDRWGFVARKDRLGWQQQQTDQNENDSDAICELRNDTRHSDTLSEGGVRTSQMDTKEIHDRPEGLIIG